MFSWYPLCTLKIIYLREATLIVIIIAYSQKILKLELNLKHTILWGIDMRLNSLLLNLQKDLSAFGHETKQRSA